MNKKTYVWARMVLAVLVAGIVSTSVVGGNYVIPIIVAIGAAFALYLMKKSVKEVIEDERDYYLAGNAARWTVLIYASIAAIGSMIFMAMRAQNTSFELVASVLAYSACGLLILQSILFKVFQNKK